MNEFSDQSAVSVESFHNLRAKFAQIVGCSSPWRSWQDPLQLNFFVYMVNVNYD